MTKGKIVQVMGPVVDVEFESQSFPASRTRWKLTTAGNAV